MAEVLTPHPVAKPGDPGAAGEPTQPVDLFGSVVALFRGQASLSDVERALDEGANPNAWTGPLTPVRCAVQYYHPRLLRLLLDRRADPDARDDKGVAPLHTAAFSGKTDCIRLLLEAGASPNVMDDHGQTPLFFVPNRQVCQMLLYARANLHVKNDKNQLPIHFAALAGLVDCIKVFAEHDSECLFYKDARGNTAMDFAARSRVKSAVSCMQELTDRYMSEQPEQEALEPQQIPMQAQEMVQSQAPQQHQRSSFTAVEVVQPVCEVPPPAPALPIQALPQEMESQEMKHTPGTDQPSFFASVEVVQPVCEVRAAVVPIQEYEGPDEAPPIEVCPLPSEPANSDAPEWRASLRDRDSIFSNDQYLSLPPSRAEWSPMETRASTPEDLSAREHAVTRPVARPASKEWAHHAVIEAFREEVLDPFPLPHERAVVEIDMQEHQPQQPSDPDPELQATLLPISLSQEGQPAQKKAGIPSGVSFALPAKLEEPPEQEAKTPKTPQTRARSDMYDYDFMAASVSPGQMMWQDSDLLEWEVVLTRESPAMKFGFLPGNGRAIFQARMSGQSFAEATSSPSPARRNPSSTPGSSQEGFWAAGPNAIIVMKITEGSLLDIWNQQNPDRAVRLLDRIVHINGHTSMAEMMNAIQTSSECTLGVVRYPPRFCATLTNKGTFNGRKTWGFTIGKLKGVEALRVLEIMPEGSLTSYNQKQMQAKQWHRVVLPDMHIVSVNGAGGDNDALVDELKKDAHQVTLHLERRDEAVQQMPPGGSPVSYSGSPPGQQFRSPSPMMRR